MKDKTPKAILQLCHGEAVTCAGGAGREAIGIHHSAVSFVVHSPGELGERDGLSLEVGTVAEEDGCVEVDGGVYLTREGVVGGDVTSDLHHAFVEVGFVGEDYGMGIVAGHRVRGFESLRAALDDTSVNDQACRVVQCYGSAGARALPEGGVRGHRGS